MPDEKDKPTGGRRVTQAPPPVPVLSGSGGFHPPSSDPNYWAKQAGKPDWSHWSNMAIVELGEACYLSLDIDPRGAQKIHDAGERFPQVRSRLQIAGNNLGRSLPSHMTDADRYYDRGPGTGVNLAEFRTWGESLPSPFTFPDEFPGTSRVSATRAAPSNEELASVARMDLWSQAELSGLCAGLLPSASDRSDEELVAMNAANEAIARGALSGNLAFVPRDDADTAARMYGTARHYEPAVAAEWAATRFKAFPASLLAAVRQAAPQPVAAGSGWPWGSYETELLRKLAAAAAKFWKLYDPADPSTAPTNDAVAAWLKEQGVAERNAQVMATILRADRLPTGPRR